MLHNSCFSIGSISVGFSGRHAEDVALVPSLEPFRIESGNADINVNVEWVPCIRRTRKQRLFDSGSTWQLYEDGFGFKFEVNAPAIGEDPYKRLLIDRCFRRATLQVSQKVFLTVPCPMLGLDYPLDELLITHRLTQEKAIELHGTGIVRANGVANLFVGHSGAGKSTTTRLWTDIEDVEVLSDDRIIVRRDEVSAHACEVETPIEAAGAGRDHGVLRLRERSASPITHSAQDDKTKKKMRMYGTPWHGEAMFASPNSAPLTRIFVLEHGHGNVITPLSPSQAVAELFARSFVPFHRHEYVDSVLVFLEELVDSVPVYRYSFEPDQRAVDKIRHFND